MKIKLHLITWIMIGVGVLHLVLGLVLYGANGYVSPLVPIMQMLGSVSFFFFAGVLEFLARIVDVLEGAVRAQPEE
jgi:hypothetical protein